MCKQFYYNHIRVALTIARDLAKDIGTDTQRREIEYAERMLRLCEEADYPAAQRAADAAFFESAKDEFAMYGCD